VAAPTLAKIADSEEVWGSTRVVQYTYTGNAAYTAGGDVPTTPLRSIRGMTVIGQNTASFGVIPVWNSQTGKIQLFQQAAGAGAFAEFSGNASTFSYTLLFISIDD
jgi:hypothetical protein